MEFGMDALSEMGLVVKGTFLEVRDDRWSRPAGKRPSSAPAACGCRGISPRCGAKVDAAVVAQVAHLDAIIRGGVLQDEQGSMHNVGMSARLTVDPQPKHTWNKGRGAECSVEALGEQTPQCSLSACGDLARGSSVAALTAKMQGGGSAEEAPLPRGRPCKGKRERLNRAVASIEKRIAENPDLFSSSELRLPAFFDQNPQARARIMAQFADVAAMAYRSIEGHLPEEG